MFSNVNAQSNELEKLNCAKKSNIGLKQWFANFPYNQTTQIKIVSYQDKEIESPGEKPPKHFIEGEELQKYIDELIAKKDSINENKFDKIKTLNFNQIEKLTNIIYNYGFKGKPNIISTSNCYMPRNAILFYDNKNQLLHLSRFVLNANVLEQMMQELIWEMIALKNLICCKNFS